ncbi:putative very short patch repair endonuclease [Geobacter sp. OR-1]|uniref:very short patch repair endonuclease n=1 Tax=Geobacter sp. OR-1 TaxID=1266765 RepID=UPI0005428275|nr:very short patch repair endonuclease [Geobacter sp. OR-1]GAM11344.1 putative very short patch repair endonuclease [Geobacter sp. OR-1]
MADIVSSDKRSQMMSGIKGKNTKLEILVRRGLFSRRMRFRLHVTKLPGKPDLVFAKYRTVVFVNGCFWHGHNCSLFRLPSTNSDFWKQKIQKNRENDAKHKKQLAETGWKTITIWECTVRGKKQEVVTQVLDALAEMISQPSLLKELSKPPYFDSYQKNYVVTEAEILGRILTTFIRKKPTKRSSNNL